MPYHTPAPNVGTQRDRAAALLERHGIMRLTELKDAGVHTQTVARMTREGTIRRVARGLYQLANADDALSHTLAEAAKAVPRGVVCLVSALQFHELTLQMPPRVWMAIDRKAWLPRIDGPPLRIVRFGAAAMTTGVGIHRIDKVETPIFGPAKTIVDCFRYRRIVGLDIALEGLRNGIRSRKAHPDDLVACARALRIWSVMQPYLDATLADEG